MKSVVVTGLGWVTCLGHGRAEVLTALRERRHGFTSAEFLGAPHSAVKVAAPVPGFNVASTDPIDWTWPEQYTLEPARVRGYAPHVVYGHCALQAALAESGLTDSEVRDGRTGLYTASVGSPMMLRHHEERGAASGWRRGHPMGVVSSVAGTLNFNLAAALGVRGSVAGFVSACASGAHALGHAWDEIALGRQDRVLIVAAEDLNAESLLPFSAMGALSQAKDPSAASRPFDVRRDGFVGTGGGVAMVLESAEAAQARGVRVQARVLGWGQAADGFHVAMPHPQGEGIRRAMELALQACKRLPGDVGYINAHATSTPAGDRAEALALRAVFAEKGAAPAISSTKGLTGHSLSMSGLLEASFCVLALSEGFIPGNAPSLEEIDPVCEGLNLPLESVLNAAPQLAMNNSSGFGGSNVSHLFAV